MCVTVFNTIQKQTTEETKYGILYLHPTEIDACYLNFSGTNQMNSVGTGTLKIILIHHSLLEGTFY